MARHHSIFLTMACFLSLSVEAAISYAQEPAPTNNFILCKNQKNVRSIRVEKIAKDNICVAFYTKAGLDKEVGRGQNYMSCLKIIENIKSNLEKSNWKCKGHEKVSITGSSAETAKSDD